MLLTGAEDKTVPPSDAEEIAREVPAAELRLLPGLGHLAHEEAPETVLAEILSVAERVGLIAKEPSARA